MLSGSPQLEVRWVVRVNEAGNPVRNESVEVVGSWMTTRNVSKRREVRTLAWKHNKLRMPIEELLQKRRSASMMSADENWSTKPFECTRCLHRGRNFRLH